MKVILVQANNNFKFYYKRYAEGQNEQNKKMVHFDEEKDANEYIDIPIFIVQPYHNKGPKEDKSIDSIWESQVQLDENGAQLLKSSAYGSKQLVSTLLTTLGFVKIETKEKKKRVEVYTPDQIQSAYDQKDAIDNVLKANKL